MEGGLDGRFRRCLVGMVPAGNDGSASTFGTALADRLKHDARATGGNGTPERSEAAHDVDDSSRVCLGPAMQIDVAGGAVSFIVPFAGRRPDEHWLGAYHEAVAHWPAHLSEPRLEPGYGVQLSHVPVAKLEEHVDTLKRMVDAVNLRYEREIEPELRRQREEARRRLEEERRLRAEVEATLERLLG